MEYLDNESDVIYHTSIMGGGGKRIKSEGIDGGDVERRSDASSSSSLHLRGSTLRAHPNEALSMGRRRYVDVDGAMGGSAGGNIGFFSLGLKQQMLQKSGFPREQPKSVETVDVGNRKRAHYEDVVADDRIGIVADAHQNSISSSINSDSLMYKTPKHGRFSFVSDTTSVKQLPRFTYELVSPLEKEIQHLVVEMRQETAFIETLNEQVSSNLRHSKRLLNSECSKFEESLNPEWLELGEKKLVKLTRQVLVPTYRFPHINFVGRIIGVRGTTMQKICKKYKCTINVMGANSTKDRKQEIALLNSGDQRYSHFAGPLHIRIDVLALPHIAHMRLAAVLNLLHKLFIPGNVVDLDALLADVDVTQPKGKKPSYETEAELNARYNEETANLEAEFETLNSYEKRTENYAHRKANNGVGACRASAGFYNNDEEEVVEIVDGAEIIPTQQGYNIPTTHSSSSGGGSAVVGGDEYRRGSAQLDNSLDSSYTA